MKEDTVSKHMKDNLKKAADTLQKQCYSLKWQVTELKEKICERVGRIVDEAKQKGRRMLYKIIQVTDMRKKLNAIKSKVDQTIDRMENLEKEVEEWQGRQEQSSQAKTSLPNCAVAESQLEYGAELFEQYQRKHGSEQAVQVADRIKQEVEKIR